MLLTKEGSNSRAARVLVETTAGTLLQLAFDIPAGLLGTCPCAHRALPSLVQQGCTALAAAFLSLHLWCGRVFVLVTVVLIAVVPATSLVEIWTAYLTSKTSAFFWLIPSTVVVYALIRMRSRGAAKLTEPTTRGNAVMRDPAHRRVSRVVCMTVSFCLLYVRYS